MHVQYLDHHQNHNANIIYKGKNYTQKVNFQNMKLVSF